MRLFKVALPLLVITSACNKKDPEACPVETVDVPVTLVDLSTEDPITENTEVTVAQQNPDNPDGANPNLPPVVSESCEGSGADWVCPTEQGGLNLITATAFPTYEPTSAEAFIDGPDCEELTIELRMPGVGY